MSIEKQEEEEMEKLRKLLIAAVLAPEAKSDGAAANDTTPTDITAAGEVKVGAAVEVELKFKY